MATKLRSTNTGHAAGIFADMTLDGPVVGTLVAVIDRARNLPNRKTMGKQDPYCALRLGKDAKKTETDKRGGQTPKWDQELRFTVHESPDYYKLKCSVFNDDKRTDLIGEAWIMLHDLIKPGGGQNDLWHQLNFKGKYAGEVRIELTYYDIRPSPDPVAEKKQKKAKSVAASESTPPLSSGRQLGPREVKRRPLPPGPGQITPEATPPKPSSRELPTQPQSQHQPQASSQSSHNPPKTLPPPPVQPTFQDSYQDVSPYEQPSVSQGYDIVYQNHSQLPHMQDLTPNQDYSGFDEYQQNIARPAPSRPARSSNHDLYDSNQISGNDPFLIQSQQFIRQAPVHVQPIHHIPYVEPYEHSLPSQPIEIQAQPQMDHYKPPQHQISYHDETQYQPVDVVEQPRSQRGSISPIKNQPFRDSPLRHSMTHQDCHGHTRQQSEDDFDNPPPPPPAHRDERALVLSNQSQNYQRQSMNHSMILDRSPLQGIEQRYEPHNYEQNQIEQSRIHQQSNAICQSVPPRKSSYNPRVEHEMHDQRPRGHSTTHLQTMQEPTYHDEPAQYGYFPTAHTPEYTRPRYQSQDSVVVHGRGSLPTQQKRLSHVSFTELPDESPLPFDGPYPKMGRRSFVEGEMQPQVYQSEPQVVRPRAVSPNTGTHMIPRKSVSPNPHTPNDRNSFSAEPFGPDSYDILNPGISPSAQQEYAESEQAKEAARLNEVNKLRDQGPIIGNDGRVIDPSDHLPSDTWAPEPERKNRKPEHVITFRTKEGSRARPISSSPATSRPNSAMVTYQSSPAPVSSPSTPGSAGRRNKLTKQSPTRPLPVQPYPRDPSKPVVGSSLVSSSPQDAPKAPPKIMTHQRKSNAVPDESPKVHRPALSEYQVPAVSNYSPRGSAYGSYESPYTTPTKERPAYNSGHNSYNSSYSQPPVYQCAPAAHPADGQENSLALELASIDIGPSRGNNRSMVRAGRPYGY